MDGLRAFAILPVILFHFKPTTGALAWTAWLCNRGWIGVELFFVLSGFLITGILVDSAHKPNYYKNFIVRRALRVLPLYYIYLAAVWYVIQLRPNIAQDVADWGGLKWYSFYFGNWRMAMMRDWPPFRPLTILWSLEVEEQFYLFYPMVIAFCPINVVRRVLWSCVIGAPILRCASLLFLTHGGMTRYVLTPLRMDALALGGLIALKVRQGGLPDPKIFRVGAVIGILLCAAMFLGFGRINNDYDSSFISSIGFTVVDVTCALLVAYVISSRQGRLAAFLRFFPLVFIGQISYGLYLFHYPVGMVIHSALGRLIDMPEGGTLQLVLALAFSIALASFSWLFFESRILRFKERFAYKHGPSADTK